MRRAFDACAMLLAALTVAPASAETIRCGNSLVSEGSTVDEIVIRCGSPSKKTSTTEDIRAPIGGTAVGTRVVGTTTTETWTYERGSSAPPFVITIIDGKVRSITRLL